ncbi:MAG: hypothetical protein LBT09_11865 [Planctomycetaceae bacterium]|nr:hypothetical protein [Planctomycetaceae bacterium]
MKRLVCILTFALLFVSGLEVFAKNESVTFKNKHNKTIHIAIGAHEFWTTEGGLKIALRTGSDVVGWFSISPGQTRTFSRVNATNKRGGRIFFAIRDTDGVIREPRFLPHVNLSTVMGWCAPKLTFHGKSAFLTEPPRKGSSDKNIPGAGTFDFTNVKNKELIEIYLKSRGWVKTNYYEVPYGMTSIDIVGVK